MTQKTSPLTKPGPYRIRRRLGFRVTRLAAILEQALDESLAPHGLSRLEWSVLASIGLEEVTTPSDIAGHLGITRPATSRVLTRMRGNGLLAQDFDAADARKTRLRLTDKGRHTLSLCLPLVEAHQTHFLSKVDPAHLEAFQSGLDALLEGEKARFEDF